MIMIQEMAYGNRVRMPDNCFGWLSIESIQHIIGGNAQTSTHLRLTISIYLRGRIEREVNAGCGQSGHGVWIRRTRHWQPV